MLTSLDHVKVNVGVESEGISSAEPSLARKRRKVIEDEFCFLKFPRDPTSRFCVKLPC